MRIAAYPANFRVCLPSGYPLHFHRRLSLEDGILRCPRAALYFGVYPFGCRAVCIFRIDVCIPLFLKPVRIAAYPANFRVCLPTAASSAAVPLVRNSGDASVPMQNKRSIRLYSGNAIDRGARTNYNKYSDRSASSGSEQLCPGAAKDPAVRGIAVYFESDLQKEISTGPHPAKVQQQKERVLPFCGGNGQTMLFTIENELIKVVISDIGAELQNYILKEDGTEYLWQGDPKYWSGRAFNLFPICGRLTEGRYLYDGKSYDMRIHGFLREMPMQASQSSPESVTFTLTESEATLAQYPFRFVASVTYTVEGTSLITAFTVKNPDTKELIFCVGGHPGFNIPLTKGEKFEDYYLEFTEKAPAKHMIFSESCMYTDETKPLPLENGTVLRMRHDLFDNDAIFIRDMCREVTLCSDKSAKSVRVTYPDMKYLGLWHKPKTDAPYCCIEPWCSVPSYENVVDHLETKMDMEHLPAGGIYTSSFRITIS